MSKKTTESTIRDQLKEAGLYKETLELEIQNCAFAIDMRDALRKEMGNFPFLLLEKDSKGEPKRSINPLLAEIRQYTKQITLSLQALGMNYNSKKLRKGEEDGEEEDDELLNLYGRLAK